MDRIELTWALSGGEPLPDRRYDVIAQAINDRLIELGVGHVVPTATDMRDNGR